MTRRFLCRLLGHRRGLTLFRYARPAGGRSVSQWPDRRGPAQFVECGFECGRCGAKVETGGGAG